jgi:PIN domain nuclease of toxin-antitoxin system
MLIDTHILLWFREGNDNLVSNEIERILEAQSKNSLFISTISIWEIAILQKQNRIALHNPIQKWIQKATQGIKVWPITPEIALESVYLPNFNHKDPADRFIIATARVLGLEMLTKDQKILDYMKLGYIAES